MARPQFIDWRMLLGEELTPNQKYSKIINYDLRKAPFENNWYQRSFTSSRRETTDKYNIALTKRNWLEGASFLERDLWFSDDFREFDVTDWDVTDDVFLDGHRYLMLVSKDKTKKKIFRQAFLNEPDVCWHYEDEKVTSGHFLDITWYFSPPDDVWVTFPQGFFPTNNCVDDKFTIAFWPKGRSVANWESGKIVNKVVGNEVVTYFFDDNWELVNAEPWDFIYVYDGTFSTQLLWISASVSDVQWHPWVLMEWPFAWFNSISVPTKQNVLDPSWSLLQQIVTNSQSIEVSDWHKRKLFKNRWDILYFATLDGIMSLNDDWIHSPIIEAEYTYEWNTYFETRNWLYDPRFLISSLKNKDESLIFLDGSRWLLYHWLAWYQKAYFDPRNSYEAGKRYNDIALVSWYVVLIGRESLSLMNPKFVTASVVDFWWEISVDREVWCFNKWAWKSSGWVLHRVWSDAKYRKTVVETYGEFAIVPKTQVQFVAYQSDMDIARRDIDRFYVDWDGLREYIFVQTSKHTFVYVKDVFWLKWVYWNLSLRGIHKWAMYWTSIYDIDWYKDNWVDYDTVIQMTLWDTDFHQLKQLYSVKLSVWYNSVITKNNTFYTIEFDNDGWNWYRVNGDLHRSSYIKNIMKLKDYPDPDQVFENQPIGIELNSWNGQVSSEKTKRNLDLEYDKFITFNENQVISQDSNSITKFDISKFWVLEIPYNVQWNVIHFSITTRWSDMLETMWIWMVFEPMDINSTRMWDVLTINDKSFSGFTIKPLTSK